MEHGGKGKRRIAGEEKGWSMKGRKEENSREREGMVIEGKGNRRIEGEGRDGAWGERKEENCRGREEKEH